MKKITVLLISLGSTTGLAGIDSGSQTILRVTAPAGSAF